MTVRHHINWDNQEPDLKEAWFICFKILSGVFAVLQEPVFHRCEFDPFLLF